MADSTTHLRSMSAATIERHVLFNAMVDAASPSTFGAYDALGSSGLTWAFFGGKWLSAGAVSEVANGTLTLTGSTTNYIQFDPATGAIESNTSAFTAGKVPLYTATTSSGAVTSYEDYRLAEPPIKPRVAISMSSDANLTLSQVQARALILDITSSATLTTTRNIVLPLNPQVWIVYNGTTGSQSLQFIGASGTGITVANGKRAILYADATNIVRVTADQ